MAQRQRGRARDRLRRVASWIAVATLTLSIPAMSAHASLPGARQAFAGYATGAVVHADAIEANGTRLVNVDQAFSGASVDSRGLGTAIRSELKTLVQPKLSTRSAYARGTGLEVGLAVPAGVPNQVKLAGLAEAAAAPASKLVRKELGPLTINPLAYASALRGQAAAEWPSSDTCPLGEDISRGNGFAADLQLVNTGAVGAAGTLLRPIVALDATKPSRAVASSTSRTVLVRQTDSKGNVIGKNFGLMSEVRMTIAPVTLLRGTANQMTIEFLGEWVMQVVASGVKGGAFVHYGPGSVSPSTPVLRVVNAVGSVTNLLTTQQLLGNQGLAVAVPGLGIELALGEDPRAIGGSAASAPRLSADGTKASAAIDVVRVRIPGIANLRVGHMEAASSVPAGGIVCELPTRKAASDRSVLVGKRFTTTITVDNPFGCTLQHVRVVDRITTSNNARFGIAGTSPHASSATAGSSLSAGTILWKDIGSIPAGKSKTVSATFSTAGTAGLIKDKAVATGIIGTCSGSGGSVTGVAKSVTGANISGGSHVVPVDVSTVLHTKHLPNTGVGTTSFYVAGMVLLGAAFATRRALKRFA